MSELNSHHCIGDPAPAELVAFAASTVSSSIRLFYTTNHLQYTIPQRSRLPLPGQQRDRAFQRGRITSCLRRLVRRLKRIIPTLISERLLRIIFKPSHRMSSPPMFSFGNLGGPLPPPFLPLLHTPKHEYPTFLCRALYYYHCHSSITLNAIALSIPATIMSCDRRFHLLWSRYPRFPIPSLNE